MARLRNLSSTFLKPFHSPDSSHTRSVSQPLSVQTSASASESRREREQSSPGQEATSPGHAPSGRRDRSSSSRPVSMVYGPSVDVGRQDVEELIPVFSFLSSHNNKLYQEGYFLKLNDLDTHGRPSVDRNWTECFAQLVGTVLSLWDAAALDAAGQDGEVAPTFINLADASIKMIETLPTRNQDVQPLQNVLSVSTAGKNRYLLHFNSLHSLTQWTAGIRLAMFEHASLQELYTGSLIAGKGKYLNNIRTIMERSKFRTEDWARVRFGAGTPWRRCWCVVNPPDEKMFNKEQKSLKKKSPYDRPARPRGDIKFYDTKKTKKAMPIATITDAYSAYAIYPQSKPLINQSTLVKVEGKITIHSTPESRTEGFVFVMPEVHPAVSGFEMMLRWLFPVYDNFGLYGRPERLIADTRAANGLMFAMPKEKRYGYLDIIDVAALIHTKGSERWTERDWRRQLKEATKKRMDMVNAGRTNSNLGASQRVSASYETRKGVRYDDGASIRSQPGSSRHQHNKSTDAVFATRNRSDTVPSGGPYPLPAHNYHARSVSESVSLASPAKTQPQSEVYPSPSLSADQNWSGDQLPPKSRRRDQYWTDRQNELGTADSPNNSDNELGKTPNARVEEVNRDMKENNPPAPVAAPPTFTHQPGDRPQIRPNAMPELRREKSRMSTATLSQMVDANKMGTTSGTAAAAGAAAAWKAKESSRGDDQGPRGVNYAPTDRGMPANQDLRKGMVAEVIDSPAVVSAIDPKSSLQVNKSRQSSSHSIARKPLPRSSSEHSANRNAIPGPPPPGPTITGNESVLGLATDASLLGVLPMRRQPSDNHSQRSHSDYDRDDVSEPDYSSRKSNDTRRSESKPRAGVLKSVGNLEMGPEQNADIPAVDFGPTQSLKPNISRPGTAMSGTAMGRMSPQDRSPSRTLRDEKRLSYLRTSSPGPGASPSRSPIPWQPVSGGHNRGPSLSPEEFVQQRAAVARMPNGAAPQRSRSEYVVPVERPSSMIRQHSTNMSSTVEQDYNSRLSAHEQEHVARMTGTPLVMNVPDRRKSPDPSIGLIGAIEAREQERRNMREGVSGQMVQHAIAQRQAQTQAQQAAQYAYNYSQQQQQARPAISQDSLSYNYPSPQQQVQQQQGYGHMPPGHLAYNYPQHPVDTRQNSNVRWTSPQEQAYWAAQQAGQEMRQQQGSQEGRYSQQAWSGYQR